MLFIHLAKKKEGCYNNLCAENAIPNNLGIRAGGEEANAVVCKITIHRFKSGPALQIIL